MTQTPSVGRIVHYVSYGTPGGEYGKECRAAVITQTWPDSADNEVGLAVLNPTGMFFHPNLKHDGSSSPAGGTWHWPERVDAPTTTSGEAYTTSAGAYDLTPSSIDPDELERLKSSGPTCDAHAKLDELLGPVAEKDHPDQPGYRVIPDPDRRHDVVAD